MLPLNRYPPRIELGITITRPWRLARFSAPVFLVILTINAPNSKGRRHARNSRAGPLHGIRVLGFGHKIAGPLTAVMLADQGTDVVHIDAPGAAAADETSPSPTPPARRSAAATPRPGQTLRAGCPIPRTGAPGPRAGCPRVHEAGWVKHAFVMDEGEAHPERRRVSHLPNATCVTHPGVPARPARPGSARPSCRGPGRAGQCARHPRGVPAGTGGDRRAHPGPGGVGDLRHIRLVHGDVLGGVSGAGHAYGLIGHGGFPPAAGAWAGAG